MTHIYIYIYNPYIIPHSLLGVLIFRSLWGSGLRTSAGVGTHHSLRIHISHLRDFCASEASNPYVAADSRATRRKGWIFPKVSKDPNNRASGPKYFTIYGIWALKPCYLGPWTLRVPIVLQTLGCKASISYGFPCRRWFYCNFLTNATSLCESPYIHASMSYAI